MRVDAGDERVRRGPDGMKRRGDMAVHVDDEQVIEALRLVYDPEPRGRCPDIVPNKRTIEVRLSLK